MGNHRAERGNRRTASAERAPKPLQTRNAPQGGARKATASAARVSRVSEPVAGPAEVVNVFDTTTLPAAHPAETHDFAGGQPTGSQADVAVPAHLPAAATYDLPPATVPGKRRAAKPAARGPRLTGLPSLPVVAGAAALTVSIAGAVMAPGQADDRTTTTDLAAANALPDASAVLANRDQVVSRDSRREAKAERSEAKRIAAAEAAAAARSKTLQTLHVQANREAAKIEANQWHMPVSGYRLSATFGLSSYLWSTVHTGLDFAAPSGTPLVAVANGTITEVGYDGSYGNKTVLTLEDGTEIWYCHQSSWDVSVGQTVTGGDVIGAVGSTGNSTGPHLHLEIRPGGGNPVDPYSTLLSHGLQP